PTTVQPAQGPQSRVTHSQLLWSAMISLNCESVSPTRLRRLAPILGGVAKVAGQPKRQYHVAATRDRDTRRRLPSDRPDAVRSIPHRTSRHISFQFRRELPVPLLNSCGVPRTSTAPLVAPLSPTDPASQD